MERGEAYVLKGIFSVLTNANSWSIDNILAMISILLAIIGGFFAYRQWEASNKIKRAEFINQIIKELRFDKEMAKSMYVIEYNLYWYNSDFHSGNPEMEYSIDRLLSYLCYVCYTYKLKNISKNEFSIIRYRLNRTCSSPSVQGYLWNLFHFSKSQNAECSFQYLIDYGIDNKIIDKQMFYDEKCKIYHKYLNF
jgi:hypothetical protein